MPAKQNWVVTFGSAEIQDGQITHTPRTSETALGQNPAAQAAQAIPTYTWVSSNIEFEQGTITWEAYFEEEASMCQVIVPAEPTASRGPSASTEPVTSSDAGGVYLFAGLNCLGAPYGMAMLRTGGYEPVGGAGHGSPVATHRWIQVMVKVIGSNVDLYIDGVKVLSAARQLKRGPIGIYLQGNARITVRNIKVDSEKPVCFVVMQFTPEFDVLFKDVIQPVCAEFGYTVIKADDFYTSGSILQDITKSIQTAALIIADITPDNPNVFYELGYAHAIGKPTILLSDRKRERLPFDVSGFRTLFYDNTIGGKAVVEDRLRRYLQSIRSV